MFDQPNVFIEEELHFSKDLFFPKKSAKNLKGERPLSWKTTFKLVYSPFSERKKGIAEK